MPIGDPYRRELRAKYDKAKADAAALAQVQTSTTTYTAAPVYTTGMNTNPFGSTTFIPAISGTTYADPYSGIGSLQQGHDLTPVVPMACKRWSVQGGRKDGVCDQCHRCYQEHREYAIELLIGVVRWARRKQVA